MADERQGLFPVSTALVRAELVENVHEQVEKRRRPGPPDSILPVLEADNDLDTGCEDHRLDKGLRHAGYLARVVEAEMFEPASRTADWVPAMWSERFEETGSWSQAVVAACTELANSEPLEKPSPNDETAKTWQVPGPGGHVRHYASSRAIGEELGRISVIAEIGDPSQLKRIWLYGFFVRACEEALPPEAKLEQAPGAAPESDD